MSRFHINQRVIAEIEGQYTNGYVRKFNGNMVTFEGLLGSKRTVVAADCVIDVESGHKFNNIALCWWCLGKHVWWEFDKWVFLLDGRTVFYGQEVSDMDGLFVGETKDCKDVYVETFGELLCWWSSLQPETNY